MHTLLVVMMWLVVPNCMKLDIVVLHASINQGNVV